MKKQIEGSQSWKMLHLLLVENFHYGFLEKTSKTLLETTIQTNRNAKKSINHIKSSSLDTTRQGKSSMNFNKGKNFNESISFIDKNQKYLNISKEISLSEIKKPNFMKNATNIIKKSEILPRIKSIQSLHEKLSKNNKKIIRKIL